VEAHLMNRWSYIIVRVLQVIPTFFVVMALVFVMVRLLPGDPTSAILGARATEELIARTNKELGLDKPLPVQFAIFVQNFFRGDLGEIDQPQSASVSADPRAHAGDIVLDDLLEHSVRVACRATFVRGSTPP
jgi:ABC-type microcin C transport system permease subunit YejB